MKTLSLLILIASIASACTWVQTEEAAEDVVVGKIANVRGCNKLSETNVKVADSVGPIRRGSEKVASELLALAKNEALRLGGDTIVSKNQPEDGRQTFSVYRCE